MPDPFERVREHVPEGGVPVAFAGIVEYLDADGRNGYAVLHTGDVPLSTFVGLLELAKVDLIGHARDQWDREG